jgi:murein DD-endopeptidase MepM/ murein hydrolase activator NlpD
MKLGKRNNNKDERLPFHIAKDSQNLIRLKLKQFSDGVTKRYSRIPKQLWSSLVIVLGIFAIVLIALLAQNGETPSPSADQEPLTNMNGVSFDENGKLTANVPNMEEIGLDTKKLSIDEEEDEAASAAKILTNPEVVEGAATFKPTYPLRRQGAIITKFGWYLHPILDHWRYHPGIDIRCKKGDLIMAASAGQVTDITDSDAEGLLITIDHGNGWSTMYGQVDETKVNVGDKVSNGQQIGIVGQTAIAVEPHLHFEVHNKNEAVEPTKYLP